MMIFWMLLACSGDSLDTGEAAEVVDPSDWAVDAAGTVQCGASECGAELFPR